MSVAQFQLCVLSAVLPSQTFNGWCNRCRDPRFVEISNSGHDVHLEQPEQWREALETFLACDLGQEQH